MPARTAARVGLAVSALRAGTHSGAPVALGRMVALAGTADKAELVVTVAMVPKAGRSD
jgi:hypothetical protein